uniref:copine-3-like isoform X1 n=1 Tax=Styela clava TaxID=7725 RepID=UPI001939EBDA|nr:copine-3-like isoform X1 [Styela clava]
MSTVSALVENIMNTEITNVVPIRLCNFQAGEKDSETQDRNIFITVELQNANGKYYQIGRSGVISAQNESSVKIDHCIQAPYFFAELQRMKFVVYDAPKETEENQSNENEPVTCTIVTVAQIVVAQELKIDFQNNIGSITVRTEEVEDSRYVEFDICAEKLEKKDLFGKSDPYLEISHKDKDGKWTVIHKTEHVKDTLNPHWAEFAIRYQLLCGQDPDKDVKFSCYDYDRTGNNDLIGEAFITPSQILQTTSPLCFALSNVKKKSKKKGFGRITIKKAKIKRDASFVSYMLAGCRLHLTCAIDFTGSNGDPKQNASLHYTGSANPNKYVLSMRAIGHILQDYGCEKQITAYGFGAKIPPENQISHDFALNFNNENPICSGMEELLQAYNKALENVKLWGPTNFSPIINRVADAAEKHEGRLEYQVLLILTDGVVTDMDETKKALVRASKLPISIVIVGIGNADFSDMEFMSKGAKHIKTQEGECAARDITQIVSFRKFNFESMDTLGRNLLQKIPSQLAEYFASKKIDPTSGHSSPRRENGEVKKQPEINETQTPVKKRQAPKEPPKQEIPDQETPETQQNHLEIENGKPESPKRSPRVSESDANQDQVQEQAVKDNPDVEISAF